MLLWIKKHRKTDFFQLCGESKNSTFSDGDRHGYYRRGAAPDDAEEPVADDGAELPPPEPGDVLCGAELPPPEPGDVLCGAEESLPPEQAAEEELPQQEQAAEEELPRQEQAEEEELPRQDQAEEEESPPPEQAEEEELPPPGSELPQP